MVYVGAINKTRQVLVGIELAQSDAQYVLFLLNGQVYDVLVAGTDFQVVLIRCNLMLNVMNKYIKGRILN